MQEYVLLLKSAILHSSTQKDNTQHSSMDSIFMIMMVYSQKWPTPNINTDSVPITNSLNCNMTPNMPLTCPQQLSQFFLWSKRYMLGSINVNA